MLTFTQQFKKYLISQITEYDYSSVKGQLFSYCGGCDWPSGDNGSTIKLSIRGNVHKSGYNLHIGSGYHPALHQTKTYDLQEVVDIIARYQFNEQWCHTTMQKGTMFNYGKRK